MTNPDPINRADINRQNAEKSTGPKTEEGRRAVRFNSISHGATAKQALLPNEDPEAFLDFEASLVAIYKPKTNAEYAMVFLIRDAAWKLRRLERYENSLFLTTYIQAQEEIDAKYDPATEEDRAILAEGLSYQKAKGAHAQIQRHSRSLKRDIEKAEKQLEAIRETQAEPQNEPEAKPTTVEPESAQERTGRVGVQRGPLCAAQDDGFALSNPQQPQPKVVRMPRFSGPGWKEARKNWIRQQRKKGNIVQGL
jgi:hypothetical protein